MSTHRRNASTSQHVLIERKLSLRRRLLAHAPPGAAYVPFCGDADLAVALYAGRPVFAADTDPARVETARSRLPAGSVVKQADCDRWPFPESPGPYAVADFDAWSYPYHAFRAFLANALTTDPFVCFFTDGNRQAIKVSKCYTMPDGTRHRKPGRGMRQEFRPEDRVRHNHYWAGHVLPYLAALPGLRAENTEFYTRKGMTYFGCVFRKEPATAGNPAPGPPPRLLKFGEEKRAEFLALLASGSRRYAAAEKVGISYERVRQVMHGDEGFRQAVDRAEMQANEIVEDSLFQAARSGNVTACQVWLYNRSPDRWKDMRNLQVTGKDGDPLTFRILRFESAPHAGRNGAATPEPAPAPGERPR